MKNVLRSRQIVGMMTALCAAVISTNAFAQTSTTAPTLNGQNTRLNTTQEKDLNSFYAAKLFNANHCAVEMGKLASSRTNNRELRQFASNLQREHLELIEALRPMVPSATGSLVPAQQTHTSGRISNNREDEFENEDDLFDQVEESEEQEEIERTVTRRVAYSEIADPVLNRIAGIEQGISNTRLSNASNQLEQLRGSEFDQAFLHHLVAGHQNLMVELKALNNVGSRDFQALVAKSNRLLTSHVSSAQKIAESINEGLDDEDIEDEEDSLEWDDDDDDDGFDN